LIFQIILLFVQQIFLPGYFIYSLWRGKERSRFQWLLKVAYSGLYIFYIFLAGRWDWVSYYLRFVFPVLYFIAVYISYRRTRSLSLIVKEKGKGDWWQIGEAAFVILLILYFFSQMLPGFFYSPTAVQLAFPLENGRYYVGQGGNSLFLNQHNENTAQKFALDILELNPIGLRATGIYPSDVSKYEIYGETIHSPCDGEVIDTVNDLPDNIPPERDPDHLAGNHIVIACKGVKVLLAHLQNDSLLVEEGMHVTRNQPLGLVGNSGNTTEPHLHIHAVENDSQGVLEGEGIPIQFEGQFLVRNMVYIE
jgi:hypothetical protein